MLNKKDVIQTRRSKILQVTSDDSASCFWPELYINENESTNLNHAFNCIVKDDGTPYTFSSDKNLPENNWNIIEYTQLPIPSTSLVELTIKINGTVQHKIIHNEAKELNNIQVYYGKTNNGNSEEFTVPDGKIRNFRIEENNQGKLKQN